MPGWKLAVWIHTPNHLVWEWRIGAITVSNIPELLRYTKEHEWVETILSTNRVRMGITDFAQSALGDIVYVQLPNVGEKVSAGQVCGEVESTKSVSEIYSPVTGAVFAVNTTLTATPEKVNSDPYGEGWLVEIELTGDQIGLLSAQEYAQITA